MNYVYPIRMARDSHYLIPMNHEYITEEKAREDCNLYLTDTIETNDGKTLKFYRLHAKYAHTQEQAFAYDIECPLCHGMLKQVGRQVSNNELGLYACPRCNRK